MHNLTDKVLELYPDMEGAGTKLDLVLTRVPISTGCCVVLDAWMQASKQVALTVRSDRSL